MTVNRQLRAPAGDPGLARIAVIGSIAAAIMAGAVGGALALGGGDSTPVAFGGRAAVPAPPAPPATVTVARSTPTGVPWSAPLGLEVAHGTIESVTATGPDGAVAGRLGPTGWASTTRIFPSTSYTLVAQVKGDDGSTSTKTRTVSTQPPVNVLHATLSPSGGVVGIGAPVIATFDHPVRGAAARALVLSRLKVTSVPAVAGAWRWMNSFEAHYRGPSYWAGGTTVTVSADLSRVNLVGTGTWGTDTPRTASFAVGDAVVSTVDVTAHTMTVVRNGTTLRTVPVSTGRAIYPTKGGVHIVLLMEKEHLYDSSTVGIPIKSADGYYEKLPWSVRISNAGAFVHANPATVKYQGRLNVSHGCVNLSVADAAWFFGVTKRGDIVNVVNAAVGPTLSDAGMEDWNLPFRQWKAGNL